MILIIFALIVIGIAAFFYTNSKALPTSTSTQTTSQLITTYSTTTQTTIASQNSSFQKTPAIPSCGSNYTLFSTQLVSPNSVLSMLPLADFIPPDHVFPTPHAYIYTINPSTNVSKAGALFYAPGKMMLTQVAVRHGHFGANQTTYTLVFQPCKEFYLYFHNVPSLVYPPFINLTQNQLAKQCGTNAQYCQISTNISIAAGQAIGTIGNQTQKIFGIDIGARDYRLPLGRSAFVDPNRLCPLSSNGQPNVFDRCYAVCPYSYFTQNMQQQIRFTGVNSSIIKTGQPACGSVYQDVNGTSKGYWFPANGSASSISPEATDLFLGQAALQGNLDALSIGVAGAGISQGVYEFQPQTSGYVNRDFSNVTPSSIYCYQMNATTGSDYQIVSGTPTIIYLQLVNKTTLLMQKQNTTACGSGPWIMRSNAAKFIR